MAIISMISLLLLLVITILAMTDPSRNPLAEFCSKRYFDQIVTTIGPNQTHDMKFYRSREKYVLDLWTAKLKINSTTGYYSLSDVSHTTKNEPLPVIQMVQPKECPIRIKYYKEPGWDWDIKDFRIENSDGGPKMVYNKMTYKKSSTIASIEEIWSNETLPVLNASDIWFTSLFCNISDKKIYVFAEYKNLMKNKNRSQIVGLLKVDSSYKDIYLGIVYVRTDFTIKPSFHRLTSLYDFMGIDCSTISTTSAMNTSESEPSIDPTPSDSGTNVLVIVLIVSAFWAIIIIVIVVIVLVYRHKRNQSSTETSTTSNSTLRKSKGSITKQLHKVREEQKNEPKKKLKILRFKDN